jgi:hypothetical protein
MYLSKSTVQILKNFAQINQSIKIKEGNVLCSLARAGNIFATAEVEEEFAKEVNIYNLSQFLSALALMDTPHLKINDGNVVLKSGDQKITYWMADPDIIQDPYKETVRLPSVLFSFELTEDVTQRVMKIASVLTAPEIQVVSKAGVVLFKIGDTTKLTTNSFEMEIGESEETFEYNFQVENFKLLPGSYTVNVPTGKSFLNFVSRDISLQYYIACKKK